jgi:hypothetical protein
MHQSEAKAVVKGAMRRAGHRWDELETTFRPLSESGQPLLKTRKKFLRYIDDIIKCRGDLLIHKIRCKQPRSWHEKIELAAITSEYEDVAGIGSVAKVAVCFYDSRQFFKGNVRAAYAHYVSRLYLHEHFLERMVLRSGLSDIGEIGRIIYPILHSLIDNFTSMKNLEEHFYVVSETAVMVLEKSHELNGLVLKTVLLRERFDDSQNRLFASAYKRLTEQGGGMLFLFPSSKRMIDVGRLDEPLLLQKSSCADTFLLHNVQHDFYI